MPFQIIEEKVVISLQRNDMKLINMYAHIMIDLLNETEFCMCDDVMIIIFLNL